MDKVNFFVLLVVCGIFSSCLGTIEMIPKNGTLINIVVSGSVDKSGTKVSYDPSDNTASWEEGDEISLFVPNTEGNDNQKFVISTSAQSSDISGKIATWKDSQNVYALYPFAKKGYSFDTATEKILFDNTAQEIDAQAGNKYANGLMVAVATNATVISRTDYNIPQLKFKQVMSLFELELKDIPTGEKITSMGFEVDEQLFVAAADINPITGEIVAHTNTNNISAIVNNQSGTTASLNFSVLPVDLTEKSVSLYVTTISDTDPKKYIYEFAGGINFQANKFIYNGTNALSLTSDFIEAGKKILYLADFKNGFVPYGYKWVIADETATTNSFEGLKQALKTLATGGSSETRTIALEFPNLTFFPKDGLKDIRKTKISISCPKVSVIGDGAFQFCEDLTTALFPLATTVGHGAFQNNYSLTSITFPLITTIGYSAFNSCTSLTSIALPLVKTIGSSAFNGNISLTNVSLPLATTIESSAFQSCKNLTSVSCPLVTKIPNSVFYSCNSLTNASFPLATTIERSAFNSCTSLSHVSFPLVAKIYDSAFYGCDLLSSLEVATGTNAVTNEEVVLEHLDSDIFTISEGMTNEINITLTIGKKNQLNIQKNTLTVTDNSYTFKKIIVTAGSQRDVDRLW